MLGERLRFPASDRSEYDSKSKSILTRVSKIVVLSSGHGEDKKRRRLFYKGHSTPQVGKRSPGESLSTPVVFINARGGGGHSTVPRGNPWYFAPE